jgi:hypothetical protein
MVRHVSRIASVTAVFYAGKHLMAGFEQRFKALRFVHFESDAAYAANETAARGRAPD